MYCEEYGQLKKQAKQLQKEQRLNREVENAPDESLSEWFKDGIKAGYYKDLSAEERLALVAFESVSGVPDGDGIFSESRRAMSQTQRELHQQIQEHLERCPVCSAPIQ
jgi:hypothetical protein